MSRGAELLLHKLPGTFAVILAQGVHLSSEPMPIMSHSSSVLVTSLASGDSIPTSFFPLPELQLFFQFIIAAEPCGGSFSLQWDG